MTSSDSPRPNGQPYDTMFKLLIEDQERELLPQFWPGVEYIETKDIEVIRSPLRVDRVYIVRYKKRKHVFHLEFETASSNEMEYRLPEYHTYFRRKYKLPVLSIVVYPFQTTVVKSPIEEKSGREILMSLTFRTLCLWKLNAEDFVQEQLFRMYALLPTMQGANELLLRQAIDELVAHYHQNDGRLAREFLWFGLMLRRTKTVLPEVKQRIGEKISMWDNLIAEDPKLKKWFDVSRLEGKEEGRAEGEAKGRAEGIIQGIEQARADAIAEARAEVLAEFRDTILKNLRLRFPRLVGETWLAIDEIDSLETLSQLLAEFAVAPDEATARRALEAYLH